MKLAGLDVACPSAQHRAKVWCQSVLRTIAVFIDISDSVLENRQCLGLRQLLSGPNASRVIDLLR